MRLLAVALALLCVPVTLPVTQADVSLVRVIAGDKTFEGGEFTFRDYLVVPPGSTLTFRNATVWLDAGRLCTGRTNLPLYRCTPQLDVRGTLVLENATLDTHLWRPSVDAGYIIHVERGTTRIVGSELRHYLQLAIQFAGHEPFLIEDSHFRDGVGPLRFMQGAEGTFRGNLVESVRDGVRVTDAGVLIEGNVFRNVTQKYDASGFNWAIELTAASPNDHLWPSTTTIRGNHIENATVGIVSQSGVRSVIEDNVIRRVRAGMLLGVSQDGQVLDRTTPIVRRNLVDGAEEGIRVSANAASGPAPNATETLDLRDNVLVNVSCHGVRVMPMTNAITLLVDARDIWWGSGRGPESASAACAAIRVDDDVATVDATEWLRAPPKWLTPHLPGVMAS